MRRWVAVLAIAAVALSGCDKPEERAAALDKKLYRAVEAVPGLEEYHVRSRALGDGYAVDAEVRLAPADGQAAAGAKLVRAALTGAGDVRAVTLTLILRRGAAEHDGRWYDGTAARPEFDRQAELWGGAVDSGHYRRVLAMMQSTQRFKVAVQGWTGDAGDRPSAAGAYRKLVSASGALGLRTEDLALSAAPTERVEAGSDGGAAVPDTLLAVGEEVGRQDNVRRLVITGWRQRTSILVYPAKPLDERTLARLRESGPGVELIIRSGPGK